MTHKRSHESSWVFCLKLSQNLLVTQVSRWVLHVQLLFLLCNVQKKKRFVVLGKLLTCFYKLKKSSNAFPRHLKSPNQGNKNHTLVEKLMGGDFWRCLNTNSLFKTGLTPMLQLMLLRALCRRFQNIFKDRDLTKSPRNNFHCGSIIKRKYFLICLIRVYLAAACSHLIPL